MTNDDKDDVTNMTERKPTRDFWLSNEREHHPGVTILYRGTHVLFVVDCRCLIVD